MLRCTRHLDGDRASIRVWCRHSVSGPAHRNQVRTRCQRMTTSDPTLRKKVGKSALRESLSLDNGGPHKCSAQVRDTASALAPIALDRLHASRRGVNSGGQSGIHLDESPWLNGPEHRTDRRHQREEVVQPVGRSNRPPQQPGAHGGSAGIGGSSQW
jgi:hypothetical protein